MGVTPHPERSLMSQVRANVHFAAGRRMVRAGDILTADDPVVAGREQLFSLVEQATAAPGELRTTTHVCEVCGKTTASRAGLGAHMRVHKDS